MFGQIRSGVGTGACDFREDSIYEFGEYGAESESERLREEICAGKIENVAGCVDSRCAGSRSAAIALIWVVLNLNPHP